MAPWMGRLWALLATLGLELGIFWLMWKTERTKICTYKSNFCNTSSCTQFANGANSFAAFKRIFSLLRLVDASYTSYSPANHDYFDHGQDTHTPDLSPTPPICLKNMAGSSNYHLSDSVV